MPLNEKFRKFATKVSNIAGTPKAFIVALTAIIIWAVSGPAFNYSNSWQLTINTGTTIVTLLMVFLIQNTQNRDSKAIHIKLDELIRKQKGRSSDKYLNVEDQPDEELTKMQEKFKKLQAKYETELMEKRKKRSTKKQFADINP